MGAIISSLAIIGAYLLWWFVSLPLRLLWWGVCQVGSRGTFTGKVIVLVLCLGWLTGGMVYVSR